MDITVVKKNMEINNKLVLKYSDGTSSDALNVSRNKQPAKISLA